MENRILPGMPLRYVDSLDLYPGMRVYDKSSNREGEIIKIEKHGRGLEDVLVVFDNSDTPVNIKDYPDMVLVDD